MNLLQAFKKDFTLV